MRVWLDGTPQSVDGATRSFRMALGDYRLAIESGKRGRIDVARWCAYQSYVRKVAAQIASKLMVEHF